MFSRKKKKAVNPDNEELENALAPSLRDENIDDTSQSDEDVLDDESSETKETDEPDQANTDLRLSFRRHDFKMCRVLIHSAYERC